MSMLRSLRIRLGQTEVGSLFALDDGRCYFRFDDAYALQGQDRPVLSQLYLASTEERTRAQLLDLLRPVNRFQPGWCTASMNMDFPRLHVGAFL